MFNFLVSKIQGNLQLQYHLYQIGLDRAKYNHYHFPQVAWCTISCASTTVHNKFFFPLAQICNLCLVYGANFAFAKQDTGHRPAPTGDGSFAWAVFKTACLPGPGTNIASTCPEQAYPINLFFPISQSCCILYVLFGFLNSGLELQGVFISLIQDKKPKTKIQCSIQTNSHKNLLKCCTTAHSTRPHQQCIFYNSLHYGLLFPVKKNIYK